MTNKIVIAETIEAGTELIIEDFTLTKYSGESIVEVHYNFHPIRQYHVTFYPEHWDNAQDAINNVNTIFVAKVVYHYPELPTYDELIESGVKLASAMEGTCYLYCLRGLNYVVLADNSVITHAEDLAGEPIFPNSLNI